MFLQWEAQALSGSPPMSNKDVAKSLEDLSPIEFYEYASYVPGRTNGSGWNGGTDFKRHPQLHHAKVAVKAVRNRPDTKIYRWVGDVFTGKWEEIDFDRT